MENNIGTYSVYCLAFLNGKKYFGFSENPRKRWKNGLGFQNNPELHKNILEEGWENVQTPIFLEKLTKEKASAINTALIKYYLTYRAAYGYNKETFSGNDIYPSTAQKRMLKEYNLLDLDEKFPENGSRADIVAERKQKEDEVRKILYYYDLIEEELSDLMFAYTHPREEYADPLYQELRQRVIDGRAEEEEEKKRLARIFAKNREAIERDKVYEAYVREKGKRIHDYYEHVENFFGK